jgi:hypothetical protein
LKEWANSVQLEKEDSKQILQKLKNSIYEGKYKTEFENSPFLQDLVSSLG